MSQQSKQSHDYVDIVLQKLSRCEKVTKDDTREARQYYTGITMELNSLRDIINMDSNAGRNPISSGKNTQEFETLQRQYGTLKKDYESLKKDHEVLGKELEHYIKTKEASKAETEEKNKNGQDNITEQFNALQRLYEQLQKDHDILSKECEYYKTKNKEFTSQMGHLEKRSNTDTITEKFNTLQRLYEQLKKDHGECEYYRTKNKEFTSTMGHLEKGSNTDKIGKDYDTQQRENEELRKANVSMSQELQYYNQKEKPNGNTSVEQSRKRTDTGQEGGQSKAMDKLRQQNKKLIDEKDKLTGQIDELKTRLSMMASHKLTAGNPDIADLSDAYRPTKLAELFRELYDNEWTSAFEELEQKSTDNDMEIIDILAMIIKNVDHFCIRAQQQQFVRLKNHAMREIRYQVDDSDQNMLKGESTDKMSSSQEELADKLLKDFRKSLGTLTKTLLRKNFYKAHMSPLKWGSKTIPSSEGIKAFAEKTLDLVWMMKIQDPPMELTWCERGERFNKDMYSYYTKRGDSVTQCIWPAVVLHKGGPLMSKGVVQGD